MKLKYYYFVLLSFALTLVACDDDPVLLKDPVSALSNDRIKRSLPVAPNIPMRWLFLMNLGNCRPLRL